MSNTSAALMIMPLALMLVPDAPVRAALSVAWGASLAMSLPISTPPNAIAYGTGLFSTREMIIAGSSCTILGLLILLLLYLFAGAMIEGTFVN
ncbi:MAG: anion permease, partial [Methylacidiphilales bacterium]|nr:anion permease [Candidatus Methylacidiphilales bacterium]